MPAEVRLICAYDDPDSFHRYKEMQISAIGGDSPTEKASRDSDDFDNEERPYSTSLVAIDQSAITGESLAVLFPRLRTNKFTVYG